MYRSVKTALLALTAIILASPAVAHTGHDVAFALRDGLLHPLHGLDHLLAMVAVGLLAWQMGGAARWMLPVTFVAVMAVGALPSWRLSHRSWFSVWPSRCRRVLR
jgi:urease accessory protein